MPEFKPMKNIAAVPQTCSQCGRHVPLYQLLISYITEEVSEDRHHGIKEIEARYYDGYYCKKCVREVCKDGTEMNK